MSPISLGLAPPSLCRSGEANGQSRAPSDTPKKRGEYKAWVTPVGDFVGDPNIVDNGYSAAYFHVFIPDGIPNPGNFELKSRPGVCITIKKFVDFDGDGKPDAIEPHVQWPVYVTGPLGDVIRCALYRQPGQ